MIITVEKLIELLDSIEYIRNINYYTNDCCAHDWIIKTITDYAEGADFDICSLFWRS